MRVLISADMEGATGVTCPADTEPGSAAWDYHRVLFTSDVNAAVRGFLEAGADDVLVNDAHDTMRNLLLDRLDDRARLLIGRHKPLGMMQGIEDADAVAFVGYHTGAGQAGVLSHTYLGNTITDVRLDGEQAGEGRLNAALAAEHGVPVVLVTGDDLTVVDAARYAPSAAGAVVKTCVDRYTAVCLTPTRSAALIEEAARRGLRERVAPVATVGAHEIEVEFDATNPLAAVCAVPGVEPAGGRRVRFAAPSMVAAMRCFKAVTTIAAASREHGYG